MAFYHDKILPKLIKAAMSDRRLAPFRQRTLAPCFGKVLELGIGSGANMEFYPDTVSELIGIDPHAGLMTMAEEAAKNRIFSFQLIQCNAEELPFPDGSFDFVVSTFTLCSVLHSSLVAKEITRVLKPSGMLHYLEHGISPSRSVGFIQRRLNPIQKTLAGGCQLTKDHSKDVESGGLRHVELEQFYLPKVPKFLGYVYKGKAVPLEKS